MRSASTTGMSNSLNRFAMVLFPVPILPVNPTINVIFISSFHTKLLIFSVDKKGVYAYPGLLLSILRLFLHNDDKLFRLDRIHLTYVETFPSRLLRLHKNEWLFHLVLPLLTRLFQCIDKYALLLVYLMYLLVFQDALVLKTMFHLHKYYLTLQ